MANSSITEPKRVSAGGVAQRIGGQWKGLLTMAFWIVLLFACAGRVDWIRGWICAFVYVASMMTTGMIVHRFNHELLERRAKWQHTDTKQFDRVFIRTFLPLTVIQPAMAGLDAVRFNWSSMPFWTVFPGIGIFLLGMALVTWTLAINPYAENSVRIQDDRGHRVIRSGPYVFVRHPMYTGSILLYPATGWMLGSRIAVLIGFLMAALFVIRTSLEDRTLRHELSGYAEYAQMTRYRLLPGIW